jgi:hypothetical protein
MDLRGKKHIIFSSSNIAVTKSQTLPAVSEEMRIACAVLVTKLKEGRWRLNGKMMLKRGVEAVGEGLDWVEVSKVGFCEHGNALSDCVNSGLS